MKQNTAKDVLAYLRTTLGTPGNATADHELLNRFVSQHDEVAFNALLKRHGPMVLELCQRWLRDRHDAEDACQATFLVLASKAAAIQKRESLASWLHGVAFRVAGKLRRGLARQQAQRVPLTDDLPAAGRTFSPQVQDALDEELDRLPERYRAPLVLCYLQGLTRDEAAERLGWSLQTVKWRLERGRDLLRQRLIHRGVTLSGVLMALAVSPAAATAALPAPLIRTTMQAAVKLVTGKSVVDIVPSSVVTLAEGVLQAMKISRMRVLVGRLLLGALLACSAVPAYFALAEHPAAEAASGASKEDRPAQKQPLLSPERFAQVHGLIKPQTGELRFQEIPWLLSVWEARQKAAAEGKPILIWSGSGGAPLGVR